MKSAAPIRFAAVLCAAAAAGCGGGPGGGTRVHEAGEMEITARLLEVPDGAIIRRELYDYATVLAYEVLATHRGDLAPGARIFVAHYNPWKPRWQAADRWVAGIGGNVRRFRPGAIHRMALLAPLEDHVMGGVVDKYPGRRDGPVYWGVWTDEAK